MRCSSGLGVEKVNFVDVEQAAVCGSENAWLKSSFPFLDRLLNIKRSNYPIFRRANRQIDEGNFTRFSLQVFLFYLAVYCPIRPGNL